MKRSWAIGLVVVLALAVGAYLVLQDRGLIAGPRGQDSASPSSDSTSSSEPSERPVTVDDGGQVANAIKRIVDHPMESVVDELKKDLDPQVALPTGSEMEPLQDSWAPDGAGGGTMNTILHVPGEPDEYYLVVMVREDGGWKVLQTFYQEVES